MRSERILPVGLGYVHSYLRSRGVHSVLANFSGMRESKIREVLVTERPDLVGLSTFTFNRSATLGLARLAGRPADPRYPRRTVKEPYARRSRTGCTS